MDQNKLITTVLMTFIAAIFAAILMAWPTQLLWNGCLVPAVDGIHEIGFWQALGINVLFSMLFKASTKVNPPATK
jgi:hypothetical protein